MYYTNVGTRGGYTVYSKCLRVGTGQALAAGGLYEWGRAAKADTRHLPTCCATKVKVEVQACDGATIESTSRQHLAQKRDIIG
jgi:hypothetical protein